MAIIEREPRDRFIDRAKHLKDATHSVHDSLDRRIMALDPFSSRDRYGLFVQVQHGFHRDIDALYGDAPLGALVADLMQRRRLGLIERDLGDLQIEVPHYDKPAVFGDGRTVDLPTALGWLYVAEGSNLGAAILLKHAARLDLSTAFGARHLAGSPQGRARHWRQFVAGLNAIVLSDEDEIRVVDGAKDAFDRVSGLVEDVFASGVRDL